MKPITFACQGTLSLTPDEIAEQILDLAKWPDFRGYVPIPGIKSAEFEVKTPNIIGIRIRVANLDGSSHVEEIVEWQPDRRLQLCIDGFSSSLSRLATRFVETWECQRQGIEIKITRSVEFNTKSLLVWPELWLISFILKLAIARHLKEMRNKP